MKRGIEVLKKYVIGIDGGGTKTKAVLAETSGVLQGAAEAGLSNVQIVGAETCARTVSDLIARLTSEVGIAQRDISHIYLGLAGAGRETDKALTYEALRAAGLHEITIETDARIALEGAFGGGDGIILICGTGSICFGSAQDGEMIRAGGYGYLLGDEGSGYFFGREALIRSLKDLDGRGVKTSLRIRLEKHFNLKRIDGVIPRVYGGDLDRASISALAPLVFDEAQKGDEQAQQIIATAASDQASLIIAVAEKMRIVDERIQVALIGSIFKQKEVLMPLIKEKLNAFPGAIELVSPRFEPAIGAVLLAIEFCGISVNEEILTNLDG